MDARKAESFVETTGEESILPVLTEYVAVPAKSPAFDPDWKSNGHLDRAVAMAAEWCRAQPIEGLIVEVIELEGRTPLLYLEAPGDSDATVVLYGHLDKQPEMTGWAEGLGPWTPVLKDGKLYGRGGADDGYAAFASLTAIRALRELLDRLEDSRTGRILPASFHEEIPASRSAQAKAAAEVLGETLWRRFPWVEGAGPQERALDELILNRTWRPSLAVTAATTASTMSSVRSSSEPPK